MTRARQAVPGTAPARRVPPPSGRAGSTGPRLPAHIALDAPAVVALQRSAGNGAVASLLRPPVALQRDDETAPSGVGPRPGPSDSYLRPPFQLTPPRLLGSGADPDWALFSELFRKRNLVLGEGEAATIAEHWRRWLPLAQALHAVPGVGLFKDTTDIMNSLTSSMIDASLSGASPVGLERFNLEDERKRGVSTSVVNIFERRF